MWLFATKHHTNPFIRCDGSEERKCWHQPPARPQSGENTDTEMTRKLRLSACQFKQINNPTKHRTAPAEPLRRPIPSFYVASSLSPIIAHWPAQGLCSCSRVKKYFQLSEDDFLWSASHCTVCEVKTNISEWIFLACRLQSCSQWGPK